jgi:hypothetical protein
VIFRNDKVPNSPITASDEPDPLRLWQALERDCKQGLPGCDVLAIPHNPNLSNGQIFTIEYPEGSTLEQQASYAALRARMEPVTEMMQIKGESECRSGLWKVMGGRRGLRLREVPARSTRRRTARTARAGGRSVARAASRASTSRVMR